MAEVTAAPAAPRRSGVATTLFVAAMLSTVAVLCGLGAWQLARAAWKGDLLAELDARQAAAPIDLAEAAARDPDEIRYRRIVAAGTLGDRALRLHHVDGGMLGYKLVLPLDLPGGETLLVDAGFVAADIARMPQLDVPTRPVTLRGYARFHQERASVFTPDNAPEAGRWFWWDLPAMAAALDVAPGALSPLTLQLSEPIAGLAVDGRPPLVAPALPRPHDRHAGYAVTWFGLAIVVAGALLAWGWQRGRARRDLFRHNDGA